MNRQYEYQTLRSPRCCRLLRLIRDPCELRLELKETTIEEAKSHQYIALSYTWGAASDKIPISVSNGASIQIPLNLYAALQSLATDPWQDPAGEESPIGYDVWIWADSICINQKSLNERSQQVQLMSEIYSGAAHVLIWLGPQEQGDKAVVDLLTNLHATLAPLCNSSDLTQMDVHALRKAGKIPDASSPDWTAIGDFYATPWFSRKWVIQEVALARGIFVRKGPLLIGWDLLWQLPKFLRNTNLIDLVRGAQVEKARLAGTALGNMSLNGTRQPEVMSVVRDLMRQNKPTTLLELLCHFRESGATEHSDHLFALVGISSDRKRPEYMPDYSRDVTELYRSFAWTTIVRSSSLTVLSFAGLHEREEELNLPSGLHEREGELNLPSWVADWSISPLVQSFGLSPRAFAASGPTNGLITHDVDDNTATPLYLRVFAMLQAFLTQLVSSSTSPSAGYARLSDGGSTLTILAAKIDMIKDVGIAHIGANIAAAMDENSFIPSWVVTQWTPSELQTRMSQVVYGRKLRAEAWALMQTLPKHPDYVAGGSATDAFWRTLICDSGVRGEKATNDYQGYYHSWVAVHDMMQNPVDTYHKTIAEHGPHSMIFDQAYGIALGGRRFFATEKGYFGLAPSKATAEDIVCIVRGANVPYVLREVEGGYLFVGECYCHGVMYGEMMAQEGLVFQEMSLL